MLTRDKLINSLSRVEEFDYKLCESIIDDIYNDFENRICENCKFYKEDTNLCLNEDNQVFEFDNYNFMKVPD